MKRILLALCLVAAVITTADASRPLRRVVERTQPDGTTLTVTKQGNAFLNYYTTADGTVLTENADGALCYALLQGDRLVETPRLAHEAAQRSADEAAFVASLATNLPTVQATVRRLQAKHNRAAAAVNPDGTGTLGTRSNGIVPSIGKHTFPVIMVEFPDRAFQDTTTIEKVQRMFTEEGYHDEPYARGSVRDYFLSQSNGLYDPEFKVVHKYKTMLGYAVYGNKASGGSLNATKSLVLEALNDAYANGVDFSEFTEPDGTIPLVSIYFAGPGAHSAYEAGADKYIWAHFQNLSNVGVGPAGSKTPVLSCFVGNELLQEYYYNETTKKYDYTRIINTQTDGIGVFCHEFGHALGLPDFYYTGNSDDAISKSLLSMDYWSVMDYGQYCYDGYRPVGHNAHERNYLGWLNLTEIPYDKAGRFTLESFDAQEPDKATAYKLTNPNDSKEFILLENRKKGDWYPSFMGQGLLAVRLHYEQGLWTANSLNNDPTYQHCEYIPSGGKKMGVNNGASFADCKLTLFPGPDKAWTECSATTHEGMWAFHTKDSQTGEYLPVNPERGLYDITLTDGVLSFFYGTAAEFDSLPYDLNADGTVNVGDVTTLVNIILGKAAADGINTDLNGDGNTNVGDVTTLVNFILGK